MEGVWSADGLFLLVYRIGRRICSRERGWLGENQAAACASVRAGRAEFLPGSSIQINWIDLWINKLFIVRANSFCKTKVIYGQMKWFIADSMGRVSARWGARVKRRRTQVNVKVNAKYINGSEWRNI